jgi:hypothetical protein
VQLNIGSLAVDQNGNIFFTNSAFESAGTARSDYSNLNELPVKSGAGYGGLTTGYAAAPVVLYTLTPGVIQNYDDELDGLAVDPRGTVYFATQTDGVFAFPNRGEALTKAAVAASVYTVSMAGFRILSIDPSGNLYGDAYNEILNSGGVDTLASLTIDKVAAPTSAVGVAVSNSSTLNPITTVLNDVSCSSSPSPAVTFTARENGTETSEFALATGGCLSTLTGSSALSSTLTFTPTAAGSRSATIAAVDQGGNTAAIAATGKGQK